MIYPTARAVLLTGIGAPAALVIGVIVPQHWYVGLIWAVLIVALFGLDALTSPSPARADIQVEKPANIGIGVPFSLDVTLRFAGNAPPLVEVALAVDERLDPAGGRRAVARIEQGAGVARYHFVAHRRGVARLDTIWLRWRGAMGLAWIQWVETGAHEILVVPDLRPVSEEGIRPFLRDAAHGMMARLDRGEGAEFEALAEFQPGMDKRAIDWKQSARHRKLLAKEFRAERNNHIVLALDAGRTMCEPLAGLPRLDRAISAALVTAYIALKLGDRVGLFGFAARPRLASPMVAGPRSFAPLQRSVAVLDYSHEESNYTLALTTLSAQLHHRALIIIFTEFADPTSAGLMLRAVGRLLDRHLVLFVVMRDAELEGLAAARPHDAADISRAVTAAALLRERQIVITRLRRIGAHVLEAPHAQLGARLLDSYINLKHRDLI